MSLRRLLVFLFAGLGGFVPVFGGALLGSGFGAAHAESPRVGAADAGGLAVSPPDPAPLRARRQWVFELRYERGEVYLVSTRRIDLAEAQLTGRAMGRFALELFEGPTLVERVRFDFPLLGADPPADAGVRTPPGFSEGRGSSRIGVLFPVTNRGTRLELWDRATDRRWSLPWPPVPSEPPRTFDAGAQ